MINRYYIQEQLVRRIKQCFNNDLRIKKPLKQGLEDGADEQNRTADLLITNQLLYQLSYIGLNGMQCVIIKQACRKGRLFQGTIH